MPTASRVLLSGRRSSPSPTARRSKAGSRTIPEGDRSVDVGEGDAAVGLAIQIAAKRMSASARTDDRISRIAITRESKQMPAAVGRSAYAESPIGSGVVSPGSGEIRNPRLGARRRAFVGERLPWARMARGDDADAGVTDLKAGRWTVPVSPRRQDLSSSPCHEDRRSSGARWTRMPPRPGGRRATRR